MNEQTPFSRMIANEAGSSNRLMKALRAMIDKELIDPLEAIAIARAIRLTQDLRENTDVQNFVGTFFISELDNLTSDNA